MRRINASLAIGLAILALLAAFALAPQLFAPYDPLAFDYTALTAPPSRAHPFGTDQFGRDILSRTIAATAVDLQIAIVAVLLPLVLGCLIGLAVGWYGGLLDAVFGRLVDLVVTFPFLVLVIAIVAVLGPGLVNMYIAILCVGWVAYARLMRAEVMGPRPKRSSLTTTMAFRTPVLR